MEDCCSCHINPPCGYCCSHSNCEECGEIFLNDELYELHKVYYCEDCYDKIINRRVILSNNVDKL